MNRFEFGPSADSQADEPPQGSRIGWLLFSGGLLIAAGALLTGWLIEDDLQASGMHRMTASDVHLNPGLALLFGFGFPAGLFLAALGATLRGPSAPRTTLVLCVLGVAVVFAAGWLPGVVGRAPDAAYFGIGGMTILLCASLVFWHWARLRDSAPRAVVPALDLLGCALFCFAVAAWNLCGAAAMPSFLLEPEKVLALDTRAFAIGQMKTVMALTAGGWVLALISLSLALRAIKVSDVPSE